MNDSASIDRGYKWKNKRERIIDRDDGKCVACGKLRSEHQEQVGHDLEVHHKTPAHVFVDDDGTTYERFAHHEKNLVTLCRGCHNWASGKEGQYGMGFIPTIKVRKRYSRLKPTSLSDSQFIDQLLDHYELVRSGEKTVVEVDLDQNIERNVDVQIDSKEIATEIAEELAHKYTGVDEANLAAKISHEVERRLRDW